MSRKHKQALNPKAQAMRDAKRLKRVEAAVKKASSVMMDESFVLPAPMEYSDVNSDASSEENLDTDKEYDGIISEEEIMNSFQVN